MADRRALFGDTRLPEFLGGREVDRYIPPELRQGLGALMQGADMLNPVSAYRDYIRDVREGNATGAATNLAGFVAPGAAGAIASRVGRTGINALLPYSDDASRAVQETLLPLGAADDAIDMSRRKFLTGAAAAGAAAAVPTGGILDIATRALPRAAPTGLAALLDASRRALDASTAVERVRQEALAQIRLDSPDPDFYTRGADLDAYYRTIEPARAAETAAYDDIVRTLGRVELSPEELKQLTDKQLTFLYDQADGVSMYKPSRIFDAADDAFTARLDANLDLIGNELHARWDAERVGRSD